MVGGRARWISRYGLAEGTFDFLNVVALGVIGLLALYPFAYTLSISLSTAAEAQSEGLHLYPRHVSFAAYALVLESPEVVQAFANTVMRTALGTAIAFIATCLTAYPISRKEMAHRQTVIFVIVFTMVFNGGVVPTYLIVRGLGLINTVWSLVLPMALSAFNVIVVKSFFQQIPESLHDSAVVDGASEWAILWRIYVPLSRPALATIGLWTAVMHWNQWLDAMLYITDDRRQVLQTFLQRIVIENSTRLTDIGQTAQQTTGYTPETVKAATVIVTILPMIFLYVFMQRYLVKGLLLGGVKE